MPRFQPLIARTLIGAAAAAVLAPVARAATPAEWRNPTSGFWDVAANWSTDPFTPNNGTPAGTTYDVLIGAVGGPYAVTSRTSVAVDRLTIDAAGATVVQQGGTMTAGLLDVRAGTFHLDGPGGGSLRNARVQTSAAGRFVVGPNALLDHVTLAAVPEANGFRVRNDLTLDDVTLRLTSPTSGGFGPGISLMGGTTPGGQTIGGTGRIVFDGGSYSVIAPAESGATWTIGPGVSIETGTGGGTIGRDGATTINRGTILANNPDRGLRLAGDFQNLGTIRHTAGPLELAANLTPASLGNYVRTGGELALSGRMDLQGAAFDLATIGPLVLRPAVPHISAGTIANGTLRSSGGTGALALGDTTVLAGVLENVTLDVDLRFSPIAAALLADGVTLANNRRLTFVAGPTMVVTKPLTGTGEVVVDGRPNSSNAWTTIVGPEQETMVFGPGITLRTGDLPPTGSGGIVVGAPLTGTLGSFRNEGTISAQTAGMTVELKGDWVNAGTIKLSAGRLLLGGRFAPASIGKFERTGGTVVVSGRMNATGQTFALDAGTGSWELGTVGGGLITGGRVEASDGAGLTIRGNASGSLDTVTLAAPLVLDRYATLFLYNRLTLDGGGRIDVDSKTTSPTVLHFTVPTVVDGTGEIAFHGETTHVLTYNETGPVRFGPGVTLRATGTGGAFFRATPTSPITIEGTVVSGGSNSNGLTFAGPVSVTGTVDVQPGGRATMLELANLSGGTLTGGELRVGDGATLRVGGPIATNAGSIVLRGNSSVYVGPSGTTSALAGLRTIAAGGSLTIAGGRTLSLAGPLTVDGALTVDSTLVGTVVVGEGGIVSGTGMITDALINGGTVSPGASAGALLVPFRYEQLAAGELLIEIGGTARAQFDRVLVQATFAAGGTLDVDLIGGYAPSAGATFDIFDFAVFTGGFDSYDLPALPAGLAWDVSRLSTTGTLAVVPEATALPLAGLGVLAARRRRYGASRRTVP